MFNKLTQQAQSWRQLSRRYSTGSIACCKLQSSFLNALLGLVVLLLTGDLLSIPVLIRLLVGKYAIDDGGCCHIRWTLKVPVAEFKNQRATQLHV